MKFSDAINAVQCGARGRGVLAVTVPAEMLLAKFRYGLSPRLYSLFRLWRKPVSEWGEYIDDGRKNRWLRGVYSSDELRFLDDKVAFFQRCSEGGLATVPVLGVIGGVVEADLQIREIAGPAALEALLDRHPDGLFLKPWGGAHGEGACSVLRLGAGLRCNGAVWSPAQLFEQFRARAAGSEGRLLVQPRLRPARSLQPVMSPHGLGTVRVVTSWEAGKSRVLAACLRIPVAESDADNFLHGASGNLVAAVDLGSGRLCRALGSVRRDWPQIVEVERHPDTGAAFDGFALPRWEEVIELVARAQRVFYRLPTVGWDVAITDSGPLLVEGNAAYDADLLQVAHDRGLRTVLLAGLGAASGGASAGTTVPT